MSTALRDEMRYTEVAIIHLEPHGAQTHCHRKRLSERSVSLQQRGHGTEEDRRVRQRSEGTHAHIHTHHHFFSRHTHLNMPYKQ